MERLALAPGGQKLADVGLFEGVGNFGQMRPLFMAAIRWSIATQRIAQFYVINRFCYATPVSMPSTLAAFFKRVSKQAKCNSSPATCCTVRAAAS